MIQRMLLVMMTMTMTMMTKTTTTMTATNHMVVTLAVTPKTSSWGTATTGVSILGWHVSSATPFGVLRGSFTFCALRTSTGKGFAHSSVMETNLIDSLRRILMANVLLSKSQSFNLLGM